MTFSRSVLDIPLFHKIYDFYRLMHSYHPRIPKAERYTIWQKCENTTLSLLEMIIATSQSSGQERLQALHEFSNKLDFLKVLIRLAKDTRTIDDAQYLALQSMLQEIGKMIGGWIKSIHF
jgi:hypothetical protein